MRGVASLLVALEYAVVFAVLLAPGYALARGVVRRARLDAVATPVVAYAIAALAGYATFWTYFFSPFAGRALSALWFLGALGALVALWRERLSRAEVVQLALTFATGMFYLAVLYLPGAAIGAGQRFFVLRPSDNVLPQLIAERLFNGIDPRTAIPGWLSSDRPPLQTGIDLLVRPLVGLFPTSPDKGYECAGIAAQLVWLPATYLLCVRAGLTARGRAFALALTIFSGYCLYDTVYTWPKLLAAGFSIGALVLALPRRDQNADASLTLAGIGASLALLAHGSAVFVLVPAAALLVVLRRLPLRRGVGWALLAGVVLLAPWSAYQRFFDPPGDRLLKMHLAGINGVDPRPAASAITQTYAATPLEVIVRNKRENLWTAFGDAQLLGSAAVDEPADPLDQWRVREREHVTAALGAANLGWLALAWWWWRGGRSASAGGRGVAALLLLALVTVAFWSLALWGPGTTVTTHGPYALELLLFVALGAGVATLPVRLGLMVVALAVADLLVTWIAGSLPDAARLAPSLDPAMAALALLAAAATAVLLARNARDPAEPAVSGG